MRLKDKTTHGSLNKAQTFEQSVHVMLQENVPSNIVPFFVSLVWGREGEFEGGKSKHLSSFWQAPDRAMRSAPFGLRVTKGVAPQLCFEPACHSSL